MTLKNLERAMASPDAQTRNDAIVQFSQSTFGVDALPLLRRALNDSFIDIVICAADCIAKLGPPAMASDAALTPIDVGDSAVDLPTQLQLIGSRVWSYSGYPNCYSACLNAMVKTGADEDQLLEYIQLHIGLAPHDFVHSLKALKTIGNDEATDLMKRATAFWLPKLNKGQTKQVLAIVGKK
jgi:hypothetical protein